MPAVAPLLALIERRFDIRLAPGPLAHLRAVHEHYRAKREFLLAEHGECRALARAAYAKAVLISEASKLMILREIKPRPKKKSRNPQ